MGTKTVTVTVVSDRFGGGMVHGGDVGSVTGLPRRSAGDEMVAKRFAS